MVQSVKKGVFRVLWAISILKGNNSRGGSQKLKKMVNCLVPNDKVRKKIIERKPQLVLLQIFANDSQTRHTYSRKMTSVNFLVIIILKEKIIYKYERGIS